MRVGLRADDRKGIVYAVSVWRKAADDRQLFTNNIDADIDGIDACGSQNQIREIVLFFTNILVGGKSQRLVAVDFEYAEQRLGVDEDVLNLRCGLDAVGSVKDDAVIANNHDMIVERSLNGVRYSEEKEKSKGKNAGECVCTIAECCHNFLKHCKFEKIRKGGRGE